MIVGRIQVVATMLIISNLATSCITSLTDVYPNPQKDLYRCGHRGRKSWICDPDHVLPYNEAVKVNAALRRIRVDTKCSCNNATLCNSHGYSVAVAVMSFIPTTRSQTISVKSYAKYLREHEWMFGNCQDDVVIVVSKQERQVAASIGNTAAIKLTDRIMADVFKDTRRFFQSEHFAQGLLEMISRMNSSFTNDYVITPSFPVWTAVHMAMAAVFVIICFFSMFICKKVYT